MTKLRVLVFGGRDYSDAATVDAALSMLDWVMPNYAVGFPGGAGTRDMAARCAAAGLPLWRPVP